MRKPRDYDAELKSLNDKARQLKSRKQSQLGELVMATGADVLTAEELAGALLEIVAGVASTARKEAWRKAGVAFFSKERGKPGNSAGCDNRSAAPAAVSAQPSLLDHGTS